jgi:predicted house-cleaning noncanonical NTP pyrophosphatase (MazG superfamily)|tara:strand:- start:60 stop:383 length:324 start_codon:yes stop_codon:yes gene_type:complete
MKEKKLYYKLVRDRIPEIIEESGKEFSVCQVPEERLQDYAMRKLQEEVMEFVENPCAEEAADIMEIMNFICYRLGIHDHTIVAYATAKRVSRGGFDMGYILEWVDEK